MAFVQLFPPRVFKWGASYFAECLYGYWRCACTKELNFHSYLRKVQVVELIYYWEMRVHIFYIYIWYIICPTIVSHSAHLGRFVAHLTSAVSRNAPLNRGYFLYKWPPVRIRVRIDPPHPLVCRKRWLNGAVLRMRPEKPRSRVTAGVAR
jgi:hypothetical protein